MIQAEAILRRKGFEVDATSARIVAEAPDELSETPVHILRCQKCKYPLDGLIVSRSIVECPECGNGQLVVVPNETVDSMARATIGLNLGLVIILGAASALFVFGLLLMNL